MTIPTLILTIITATLTTAPVSPQDKSAPPRKDQVEESAKKIKELQKKRIEILKNATEASLKLLKANRLDVADALDSRTTLLRAELEATANEAERITLIQNGIDWMKALGDWAGSLTGPSRVTELDVLKIRAKHIELEIFLERAKVREAREKEREKEKKKP
ncbi:hypothetical protein [Fimbriiglobus ruber]|uniref:Uncharacterized protein n=1 Tax=Fimbriiglobus ruber TaxID=1908690 RepID=A0A225DB88_9BACT|nr:hypothetical protein [Fimbriiglobus ruber]OWK35808.1 hypothetical protein FRUB_08371 [Fimbriiglobus ruber]